jgi:hypothetical protein
MFILDEAAECAALVETMRASAREMGEEIRVRAAATGHISGADVSTLRLIELVDELARVTGKLSDAVEELARRAR